MLALFQFFLIRLGSSLRPTYNLLHITLACMKTASSYEFNSYPYENAADEIKRVGTGLLQKKGSEIRNDRGRGGQLVEEGDAALP